MEPEATSDANAKLHEHDHASRRRAGDILFRSLSVFLAAVVVWLLVDRPATLTALGIRTFTPDVYHGPPGAQTAAATPARIFFEGWYFKAVSPDEQYALAFIPGIIHSTVDDASHAFVQVMDAAGGRGHHYKFPVESFHASGDELRGSVPTGSWSAQHLELELAPKPEDDANVTYRVALTFEGSKPWPVTILAPGVIGWPAWLSLECYHGIVSMDHTLRGTVTIDDKVINMTGGRGYIEKDWGYDFPASWIWMQANNFKGNNGVSLFASMALVPMPLPGLVMPAFIMGFQHHDQLHRFTSYTHSVFDDLTSTEDHIEFSVRDPISHFRLHVKAEKAGHDNVGLLYAPHKGVMTKLVREHLAAVFHVDLTDDQGRVVFNGTSVGGLETEGDTPALISAIRSDRPVYLAALVLPTMVTAAVLAFSAARKRWLNSNSGVHF